MLQYTHWNCWQLLPAAWQGTISLAAASLTFLATCRTLQWNRETPLCYPYSLSFITYLHLYLSYLILISFIYHRSFMTYLVSGAPNKFVANKVKTRGLQWPRPGLSARMSSWDALFEPKLWVLLSGQNMMNLWMIYGWDSIIFYLSIIMGYPYNLSI